MYRAGKSFLPRVVISTLAMAGTCHAEAPDLERSPQHLQTFDQQIIPFVQKHCIACHGEERERGGLRLDVFTDVSAVAKDHAIWTKVLERIQAREMPPRREKQPSDLERARMIQWIHAELAHPACDGRPRPGHVTLRRLNRAEYENTIRDLFDLELQVTEDFPADDSGYGFDNIGDVLSISPLLMEHYLMAAERVAQAVIVGGKPPPAMVTRMTGAQLARNGKSRRGEDDEYAPFTLTSNREIGAVFDFPFKGTYTVRVSASGQRAGPDLPRMVFSLNGKDLQAVEVTAEEGNSEVHEFKIRPEPGRHRLSVKFINDYYKPSHQDPKLRGDRNLIIEHFELEAPPDLRPRPVTDAHRRVMICRPGPTADSRQACARRIVGELARRAFRRPVTPEEVERYAALMTQVTEEGDSYEQGVRLAIQAILVSPRFLFLSESGPAPERMEPDGEAYRLTGYEMASRLSYFLWSSMPDEELFALAGEDRLHDPEVLEAQVARMLKDPRSRALADNFAGQWLGLRKLPEITPDPERFPAFDDALRQAMAEESKRFFEYVLREDRDIMEFLLADYTFVNERLARHYGLPGEIEGEGFRRVAVTDQRPGGVLAQAAVLTITSDPTRTSPVKRGKWVLEQLLGTPPPPPPPDVPALPEGKEVELTGTLRQRFEQHRSNPDCKSCHEPMDPLGFGLENYDAIGRWRTRDGQFEVDAGGTLPTGESFNGPAELQRILLSRRDLFRRCLTQKMLTYALGRGVEYSDRCTVDEICERLISGGDHFSVLIVEIVKSAPFRLRPVPEADL